MGSEGQVRYVVPARNAAATLGECLDSILRQSFGVCPSDIVVVDNASSDDTLDVAQRRGVTVLSCESRGAAAARNVALRRLRDTEFRYLAFVDADVVMPRRWTEACVAALDRLGSRVAGVGGPGRSNSDRAVARLLDAALWGWDRYGGSPHRVSSLATMDALYRHEAIAGQDFDEDLLAGEDPEWCFRLADCGWEVWMLPELEVIHRHVESVGGLLRKWFWYGRYYALPYLDHPRQLSADVPIRVAALPLAVGTVLFASRSDRRRVAVPAALGALLAIPYVASLFRFRRLSGERNSTAKPLLALLAMGRLIAHSVGIWAGLLTMPRLFWRTASRGARRVLMPSRAEEGPGSVPYPIHIAHVGSKGIPGSGGTERVVEAIAARQAAVCRVTVYGARRLVGSRRYQGARVVALPGSGRKYLGPVLLQVLAALHALCLERLDIVHVHGTENGFIVPLLRLRYPVVLTSHGAAYELGKWPPAARRMMRGAEGVGIRAASIVTAVASPQADRLAGRHGISVCAIPNGVEPGQTTDDEAARAVLSESDVPQEPFILFVAARVDPAKGCHTLIEAYARLGSRLPLVVVGDLSQAPGYGERLRTLSRGRGVYFVPPIENHAALLGVVTLARVCVFPSTTEAMSMMLLEAMAVEGVVITSDIAEMRAVVPPGQPTFAAGDPADLARVLSETLSLDADRRVDLGRRARAWVEERYSWSRVSEEYLRTYVSAIDGRMPRGNGSGGLNTQ